MLNVGDLENLLASGDVEVTTTGSGGLQAKDIDVHAALSWSSSSGLTLDAHRTLTVEDPVSVSGPGGLSLTTNHGGGGMLLFGSKGKVTFANLSSILKINRAVFTLVNNVKSLAAAVAANPAGDYALANSYDASQDGIYSSSPVGTILTGTVQGLGNTISNLSISLTRNLGGLFGLFAEIGAGGTIQGMRLTGLAYKIGRGRKRGGEVGGLVGFNGGSLIDDHTAGTITTTYLPAGGLAGGNGVNGGFISLSSAKVRIKAPGYAGGLVASNGGMITLSHADGAVRGTGAGIVSVSIAGGLVGDNGGFAGAVISQSYATGAVTGDDQSRGGGLSA